MLKGFYVGLSTGSYLVVRFTSRVNGLRELRSNRTSIRYGRSEKGNQQKQGKAVMELFIKALLSKYHAITFLQIGYF